MWKKKHSSNAPTNYSERLFDENFNFFYKIYSISKGVNTKNINKISKVEFFFFKSIINGIIDFEMLMLINFLSYKVIIFYMKNYMTVTEDAAYIKKIIIKKS